MTNCPKKWTDVINTLTSDETQKPLSAAQGKVLATKTTSLETSFSNARANLISALAKKGVTVASSATFAEAIAKVNDIPNQISVVNLGTGLTKNLSAYAGYKSFEMWKNIFCFVSQVQTHVEVGTTWPHYGTALTTCSAVYNKETGVATASLSGQYVQGDIGSGSGNSKNTGEIKNVIWYLVQVVSQT